MNEIKNNHIELIDFSKCQLSSKEYNTGSMPKYGVVYQSAVKLYPLSFYAFRAEI